LSNEEELTITLSFQESSNQHSPQVASQKGTYDQLIISHRPIILGDGIVFCRRMNPEDSVEFLKLYQ